MSNGLGSLTHVARHTLREDALANLRDAILNGSLAPGQPLGEVAISEGLGVSRGTVREAFRTLQQEDLVEPRNRGGLRVRLLSQSEIMELFSVRAALEAQAIRHIIDRTDKDAVVDRIEALLPPEDTTALSYRECLDRDLAFHRAMVRSSQNGLLLRMWSTLENSVRVVVLAEKSETPKPVMRRKHHLPIVEAIREGDLELAGETLQSHMNTSSAFFSTGAAKSRT